MIRTFLIPLLAIAGVLMAVYTVVQGAKPPTAQPPVIEPPRAPYEAFVAGSGLIEANTQNITIGSPVGAIVEKVFVTVGDMVKEGDPLFKLDTRKLEAELLVRQATLSVAQRQLEKLKLGTRPEQIPPARARLAEAQMNVDDLTNQLQFWESLSQKDARAVSQDELTKRRFAVKTAQTRIEQAKADVTLLEAGTWAPDIAVAESQVMQAESQMKSTLVELDRHTVKSPVTGRVLQANVRVGEFAQAGVSGTPLMLVGGVNPLHIRVDIDEHDAWRVKKGSPATAFVRGNKSISMPLTFVRYEPYVIPKRSLTGESTERVDTRVLQVIYSFDPKDFPVFVGQQVDAYIESQPIGGSN
jgi:HlyD family secretion protein